MAKVDKICRVCSRSYKACQTAQIANTFRWQDVACSPECGAEYLRKIRLSRGEIEVVEPTVLKARESNITIDNEDGESDYGDFFGFDSNDESDDEYFGAFDSDLDN